MLIWTVYLQIVGIIGIDAYVNINLWPLLKVIYPVNNNIYRDFFLYVCICMSVRRFRLSDGVGKTCNFRSPGLTYVKVIIVN